jgi:hypothetical protein
MERPRRRVRHRAVVALGALALLVVAAASGYRAVTRSLERRLRAQLATALELEPEAVVLGRTALNLPLSFAVRDLAAGPLAAARIDIEADPLAALAGTLHIQTIRVDDLVLEEVGRVRELELTRETADRWRLSGHNLAFSHAGISGVVDQASAELSRVGGRPRLERAAFRGAEIGAFAGLSGIVRAQPGGYEVRAAREGVVLVGRVDPVAGHLTAEASLTELPLAPVRLTGLDLGQAQVSGRVGIDGERGSLALDGKLAISNVVVDHPAIALRRVAPLDAIVEGDALITNETLALHAIKIQVGGARLALDGDVAMGRAGDARSRAFDLTASLQPTTCGGLLAALRPLLPALDGMGLDGTLGATVHVALPSEVPDPSALAALALDVDLSVGCRVTADPPLADPHTLKGPLVVRTVGADGAERAFALGPTSPSFRSLDVLPVPLIRTIVAAEDGRFFRHQGFDLDMIRRALTHDLGAGGFERGASTITQQVVKNIFLSGERTLTRKLEEAVLAWRTEQLVPKRRILELYLNLVELGPGVYGVHDGALYHFGRPVESLEADEAAEMAALLPAPRRGKDQAFRERLGALKARLPRAIASAKGRVEAALPISTRRATLQ